MSELALVSGVVLGAVFIAAGVLKLSSPHWPGDAVALGVSEWVARPVPVVEVVLGALVATGVGSPWSEVAVIALLVVFSIVVLRASRLEQPPVCACFGSLGRRPVGRGHLLRNLALLALGVATVLG